MAEHKLDMELQQRLRTVPAFLAFESDRGMKSELFVESLK